MKKELFAIIAAAGLVGCGQSGDDSGYSAGDDDSGAGSIMNEPAGSATDTNTVTNRTLNSTEVRDNGAIGQGSRTDTSELITEPAPTENRSSAQPDRP